MKTQVLDNFLDYSDFKKLEDQVMSFLFPWNYYEGIVLPDDGKYQFTHCFIMSMNLGVSIGHWFNLCLNL